ncbi:MAG: PDZ domain-containing protein [Chitinophagaceae bacterium]|jgi:serine protease Do|nr:PDZ domain-containing protein [Chitinophagaceae bacterium]
MKQIMKQLSFALLALGVMTPATLLAQPEGKDKDAKSKKEAEQIIITRKGNSDGKVVIELNGDKVTVNGKDYNKDNDGDITVLRNKIKDVWAYGGTGTQIYTKPFQSYNNLLSSYSEDRAMLGVTTEKEDKGVVINEVTRESAAEKAGLKKGDIITAIDGKKIEDPDDLTKAIRDHKPGDKVSVGFIRDKKEQKVTAELTSWKGVMVYSGTPNFNFNVEDLKLDRFFPNGIETPQVRGYGQFRTAFGTPRLGISIQDAEDGKGVNVLDVDEDGNAAKAGLKEGDVITEIDGKAINGVDEMAKAMRDNKDKITVKMKYLRNGKAETVDLKMPRKLKTADL